MSLRTKRIVFGITLAICCYILSGYLWWQHPFKRLGEAFLVMLSWSMQAGLIFYVIFFPVVWVVLDDPHDDDE